MPYPAKTYISQLRSLQADLSILMEQWHSGTSFNKAKSDAEAAAPLIAGELAFLQNSSVELNPKDTVALRALIEQLHELMSDKDKSKFLEYIAMLDSLINEGVS